MDGSVAAAAARSSADTEEMDAFASDPAVLEAPDVFVTPGAPPKRKGRQRLLSRLQRISSSPSLAPVGRARSSSNPYHGPGSFSCVSLSSSPSPFGHPSPDYFSASSHGGLSTAPTSVPGTPGHDPYFDGVEQALATRKIEHAVAAVNASAATIGLPADLRSRRTFFYIWLHLPHEIKIQVLSFLEPRELVRVSRVNKEFYRICFDGQLWTRFDASEFYQEIPAESLSKIIINAGPFVKDLNLRGCVQVEHYKRAELIVKACDNLINATLEGCRNLHRTTLHSLLRSNENLANLNLTGLTAVTNATCKIIAHHCPALEMFNVSWCKHMDAEGIKLVVQGCPKLRDLRAGEIKGFDSREVADAIFKTNNLERLLLSGCDDLTDGALRIMMHGSRPEIDVLTDRPVVPARKLRHLDLSRCTTLTSNGVKTLGYLTPELQGLSLSQCSALTDAALAPILASTPRLTHLDLEDLSEITNAILSEHLAKAPCAQRLEHLCISYCESLGDVGMLPVIRKCTSLQSLQMDNTRVSDLVLAEAAAMVRQRSRRTTDRMNRPRIGLSMVVYDCQHVTWTGVREVLSRNAEIKKPRVVNAIGLEPRRAISTYPTEIIALKCFYGWQMTVDEHTKRVLRGNLNSAAKLEKKWAAYMQANEEAGATGSGGRRRRRRAREAQLAHADEEQGGAGGGNGRRRAMTLSCVVM